jgi:RNA polymerase sigma factor (sigma-70 family)
MRGVFARAVAAKTELRSDMITREEERNLIVRAKAGDNDAITALLEAHRPLLIKMVKLAGIDMDDGLQESRIAVMACIDKFDLGRRFRLMTYSQRSIIWRLRNMRECDGVIRTPHRSNLEKCDEHLQEMARAARRTKSLDAPMRGDKQTPWLSLYASKSDVIHDVIQLEKISRLRDAISQLCPQQRHVMAMRLAGQNIRQMARTLSVTPQRISEIERQARIQIRWLLTRSPMAAA